MKNLKTVFKLVDAAISAGEKVFGQFKGKTPEEAADFLKNNIKMLKSPMTLINLQFALRGKSAGEIKDVLLNAHKSLSPEDAFKIAEVLTDDRVDQKLPEYLEKKINEITANKGNGGKPKPLGKKPK